VCKKDLWKGAEEFFPKDRAIQGFAEAAATMIDNSFLEAIK
jgi:hypothetical protein